MAVAKSSFDISANFDSGNIQVIDVSDPLRPLLAIRPDLGVGHTVARDLSMKTVIFCSAGHSYSILREPRPSPVLGQFRPRPTDRRVRGSLDGLTATATFHTHVQC